MEEHLDILNEEGIKTGEAETYSTAHQQALLHRTVHIWIFNSNNQILLQKRAIHKRVYPGLWDISAAGHISAGETSLEAAQKETKEELGLSPSGSAFKLLFTVRHPLIKHSEDFFDNEFQDVYILRSDALITDMKLQDEEVEEVRWVDLIEFEEWINGKGEMIAPHTEEYAKLLEYIKSGNI